MGKKCFMMVAGYATALVICSSLIMAVGPSSADGGSKYPDGTRIDYSISTSAILTNSDGITIGLESLTGTLSLVSEGNAIIVKLDISGDSRSLSKEARLTIDGDRILSASGDEVILPFIHMKDYLKEGAVIAQYGAYQEVVNRVSHSDSNMMGGKANGQEWEDTVARFQYADGKSGMWYTYDSSCGLALWASSTSHSILFDCILGLDYWEVQSLNGFTMTLTSTSIDIGSPNYVALVLGYIYMSMPFILLGVLFLVIYYLFRRANRKKKDKGSDSIETRRKARRRRDT